MSLSSVLDGTRATGVRLLDGTVIEAGWVVLSAGTYGSPLLLMRSGIGQADHLDSVGVPVRVDLPGVGANLVDHPGFDIDCSYQGPGRTAPVLHVIGTFHSAARSSSEAPDLMLWLSDPVGPAGEPGTFDFCVALMKPHSTGTVRLRSTDPAEPPRVELPNLREASDVDRLAEGYRRGVEVANRPELRRFCAGPAPAGAQSPDELRSLIRAEAYSIPHVVGTCAMGPRREDGAVVDGWGRVHGTERLSVVDASIMPTVPSGFTHIPTIMIAEHLSEQVASLLV